MWRPRGLLAALVGSTLALGACQSGPDARPKPADPVFVSPVIPRSAEEGLSTTGRGPQIPAEGAWLGAWVKPEWHSATGRIAALDAFSEQTESQLAVAHMFHDWEKEFPSPTERAFHEAGKLPLISWSGTDTRSITSGVYDPLIRRRAEKVKDFGFPVLLRWRWEMDRPNLRASVRSPEDYVAAWKHIRAIFTEVGADNAGWVWCPHVRGFVDPSRNGAAYYPGDDQVDWLCVDVYPGPKFDGFRSQMDTFMAFARDRPRPVLIGEFGVTTRGEPGQRGDWLREAHRYIKEHPQIKAAIYFAAQESEPEAYDSTFHSDPEGLAAFRELAADPHFAAPPPTGPLPR